MTYEIDVASVRAVLLADGWHRVKGRSFGIEPIGYVATPEAGRPSKAKTAPGGTRRKKPAPAGAAVETPFAPVLGARWTKPNGEVIVCPVASVLALRHARTGKS